MEAPNYFIIFTLDLAFHLIVNYVAPLPFHDLHLATCNILTTSSSSSSFSSSSSRHIDQESSPSCAVIAGLPASSHSSRRRFCRRHHVEARAHDAKRLHCGADAAILDCSTHPWDLFVLPRLLEQTRLEHSKLGEGCRGHVCTSLLRMLSPE